MAPDPPAPRPVPGPAPTPAPTPRRDPPPGTGPVVRHVVGAMTGTSLDGIDVALVRICGRGLTMRVELQGHHAAPLPGPLRDTLGSLAAGRPHPVRTHLRAARHLGVVHAEACAALLARHPGVTVDAVAAHGQTVGHFPEDGLSAQLFDPWPVVRALGVAVVFDLRQADLIAGGQGAPVTPLADWVRFRHAADAVVNLGGIVNVTRLATTPAAVRGADVGPANLLLDGLAEALLDRPYDDGGAVALTGRPAAGLTAAVHAAVRERLVDRSLGREQFGRAWARALADRLRRGHGPADILAAAAAAVARVAAGHPVLLDTKRWLLAGGGVRNAALLRAFTAAADAAGAAARPSDDAGVPAEAREALAFAVLGALSQDGVPATLPQVTGADRPGVAGVWAFPPVSARA